MKQRRRDSLYGRYSTAARKLVSDSSWSSFISVRLLIPEFHHPHILSCVKFSGVSLRYVPSRAVSHFHSRAVVQILTRSTGGDLAGISRRMQSRIQKAWLGARSGVNHGRGLVPHPQEKNKFFAWNGVFWWILSGIFENLGDSLHWHPPSPNSGGLSRALYLVIYVCDKGVLICQEMDHVSV